MPNTAQDPEENLPEWLRALRKRQDQESADQASSQSAKETPDESEQSAQQEPSWLDEIRSRYRPEKKPEDRSAAEESDLGDTQPRRVAAAEEMAPESEAAVFELEETRAEVEEDPIQFEEPAASYEEIASTLETELPAEENTFVQDELTGSPSAFSEEPEPIDPGVLPSWLQALRPAGAFPTEDARSGEILPGAEETSGPLAGLSDVLPAEPGLTRLERVPVFSSRLEVSENQALHAATFTKLLSAVDAPPADEARRVAGPTRVLNLVIAGVMFLAVLFPLATQSRVAVRPNPQLFPEGTNVFSRIDALPAGAPVLVAFEVQPALYGEMAPIVTAIFGHLLDRQAQLVFISTRPTGPALAERTLMEQFSSAPAVATNAYTQLGYLSGGLAALRSFISDPRSATLSAASLGVDPWLEPSMDPIQTLSNFALVIVVSSSAEDGRAWIEQSAGYLPNGLVAVTSAQAAPLLRAYLQSDPLTLQGLLSGIHGAALYERLRTQDDGLGRAYWDAYSYGLGAMVLLILLGGLYGRFIRIRPEQPAAGSQVGT